MKQELQTRRRLHPIWIGTVAFHEMKTTWGLIALFLIVQGKVGEAWKPFLFAAFIAYVVYRIVMVFLQWNNFRYHIQDGQLVIQEGKFVKKEQFVPLSRIQHLQRETPVVYQFFGATKLIIQTSSTDHDTEISLHAVTKKEADWLQEVCRTRENVEERTDESTEESVREDTVQRPMSEVYRIRFGDIVKASLTSFSFIVIAFFLLRIWDKLNDIVSLTWIEEEVKQTVENSYAMLTVGIILFLIVTSILGVAYTYLRFGRYIVQSDGARIHIRKGILTETQFMVEKEKVKAVQFSSSVIRRFFGLVEVKLVCAGGDITKLESNILVPFLQEKEAIALLQQLLPQFVRNESLQSLSKQALYIKVSRALVFTVIVGAVQLYWWADRWYITVGVLVVSLILQLATYKQSGYSQQGEVIESKSGFFTLRRTITSRKNIEQLQVEQTWLQRRLGLCNLKVFPTTGVGNSFRLHDVPERAGSTAYEWYKERGNK